MTALVNPKGAKIDKANKSFSTINKQEVGSADLLCLGILIGNVLSFLKLV